MDSTFNLVEVVRFRPDLAHHFESLNREWIEQYFEIEDADLVIFADPFKEIVEPGGQIFFVIAEGKAVGTCAVVRLNDRVFELAKMAVSSEAQGRGYGDLLISSVINFAKEAGAERLILVSNTQLKPAIALYEKHGFKSVPITDADDYKRVDIQMELIFD
ncbi:MAG TPA: GNAT family N-acetyltransferase [Pyrinomonadaceae bacterium]|jgi:GNAT superfamily N-acetyltransferase|nr:GNAT family N-acetyltransferase [Pyrinomonadaceae bacterium]